MALARRLATPLRDFLHTEAAGGILLMLATVTAMVWANSPWGHSYDNVWNTRLAVGSGEFGLDKDLQHWVNDALMAVFFFVIGLEIKREAVTGHLRDIRAASLPIVAAIGGMVLPAALFVAVVRSGEEVTGWAIAMATDIAFSLGVLALLGPRAPAGLKVFLLTLAIVDDIGAITVIALFYSGGVDAPWLTLAAVALLGVVGMRMLAVPSALAYVPLGFVAWYATLKAGIHPTIAAVAIGMLTPAVPVRGRHILEELEHRLHPWSSYLIVPVFALANAGVRVTGDVLSDAFETALVWGIIVGLVAGKIAGVSIAALGAYRLGLGRLPAGVSSRHVAGAGALAGIGFTVALFIAGLAFDDQTLRDQAKIGILIGSLVSGVIGVILLRPMGSDDENSGMRASGPPKPDND